MAEAHLTDYITSFASLATALGLWFVWRQTSLLRQQFLDDHERSRREKAVDLVMAWSKSLLQSSSLAKKLVETLNEEQARKFFNSESVTIEKEKEAIVLSCLEGTTQSELKNEGNFLILDENQVSIIRWYIITYLNMLESILSARRHGIADKDVIKEEFKYLVSPSEGHYILKNFRIAAGGNNVYPAIEEFVQELEKEIDSLSEGKKPLAIT